MGTFNTDEPRSGGDDTDNTLLYKIAIRLWRAIYAGTESISTTIAAGTAAIGTVSITDISNGEYETVAAGVSDQILGPTGGVGDYLTGILIVPVTTSPGAVSIKDGNGSAISVFAGGASSVSNLVPFFVPIAAKTVNATTPGWKVTTGTNVTVFATGNFT